MLIGKYASDTVFVCTDCADKEDKLRPWVKRTPETILHPVDADQAFDSSIKEHHWSHPLVLLQPVETPAGERSLVESRLTALEDRLGIVEATLSRLENVEAALNRLEGLLCASSKGRLNEM